MHSPSRAPGTASGPSSDTDPVRPSSNDDTVPVHLHALEQLRYIRTTLESSGTFTAVSGRGLIAMGLIALAASFAVALPGNAGRWLAIWLGAGLLSISVGGAFLLAKAHSDGIRLSRGVGRRFLFHLTPPLAAGAALTLALYHGGGQTLIPGTWLLLYGVAVVNAGAFSVRPVPAMGLCFMLLGLIALALPADHASIALGCGFGGFHLLFGMFISKFYGG